MQYRRTQADVNLSAIKHNIQQHHKRRSPGSHLMAVVKANGYGHGSVPILKTALEQNVAWAGVSSVEEAIELREAGIRTPILLMGGWYPEAIPAFLPYNIVPSLYSEAQARELNHHAKRSQSVIKVHLKLETGMGRLGFSESQLTSFLDSVADYDYLDIEGAFSHLSSADDKGSCEFTGSQLATFKKLVEQLDHVTSLKWVHIANSAGTSTIDAGNLNLYRLGIGMYGQPASTWIADKINLQEAITWKTAITHLQDYPANHPIGYNRTFHTPQKTRIATLCVGYADGYSRQLSNKGFVLVRGQRAPVVGRVCMDMCMIDVSNIDQVEVHDEVILIGRQGNEYISATEMASWIGTINYEVVCGISSRVPRHYRQ